jgi:hypothetical protein
MAWDAGTDPTATRTRHYGWVGRSREDGDMAGILTIEDTLGITESEYLGCLAVVRRCWTDWAVSGVDGDLVDWAVIAVHAHLSRLGILGKLGSMNELGEIVLWALDNLGWPSGMLGHSG